MMKYINGSGKWKCVECPRSSATYREEATMAFQLSSQSASVPINLFNICRMLAILIHWHIVYFVIQENTSKQP